MYLFIGKNKSIFIDKVIGVFNELDENFDVIERIMQEGKLEVMSNVDVNSFVLTDEDGETGYLSLVDSNTIAKRWKDAVCEEAPIWH